MPKETFFNLSKDKRALIEKVAIEEFASNGLKAASVNAIVSKTSIAKGSFYQYFENLEDLYEHILQIVQKTKVELISSLPMPDNSLDTFRYLSRLVLVDMIFELKHPLLSQVERHHRFDNSIISSVDPESGQRLSGDGRFHAFLSQGVFHDDIATWVDIDMAAYVLETISNWLSPYLLERLEQDTGKEINPTMDLSRNQTVQDLLHNLMDILMAGIARDPQIRKDFYSK
jgi:AcrR family transcriptional regulator